MFPVSSFRQQISHLSADWSTCLPADNNVVDYLLKPVDEEELAAALKRMPEELRDLIVLRYYDNKPLTEVADLMGLSYGAVKLRHQKALGILKKALSD